MKKLLVCSAILVVTLFFAGCDLLGGSKTTMKVVNGSSEAIVELQVETYLGVDDRGYIGLNDALGGEGLATGAEVTFDLPPILAAGSSVRVTVLIGADDTYSFFLSYEQGDDFTLTFNGSTESPMYTLTGTGAEEVILD